MIKYFFVLVAVLTLLIGCDNGGQQTQTQTFPTSISECGGFDDTVAATKAEPNINETLEWSYDAGTGDVTITNRNICINCCGDHSIETNAIDGGYAMTEIDMKQDGLMRCKCNCLFDYRITLPAPENKQLSLDIKRLIEESGTSAVWNGTLQLESITGSILIKSQSDCI